MPDPSHQTSLLYTRLRPPPKRENWVIRPPLLEKLDAAVKQPLTLVCAPAGYGKSTLLCQWVSRRSQPVGWVSLDRSDNDPVQFLRYFLAALQQIDPGVGASLLQMLQAPRSMPAPELWLSLVNDIAASEKELVVILDDYQEVEEQVVHQALDNLLEHMPANLHLILASRADPPFSLPRLRARGQLCELRLSDLRFSVEEAADFLNNIMHLGLSAGDLADLETRTEGWIASLQMAALSLQMHSPDRTARSEFIQSFTGSHRFILDYLVEEVLAHQSPEIQDFLLKTSILERLSGSLCDAVAAEMETASAGSPGVPRPESPPTPRAQSILEHLESANLFILPLDDERCWYRYHRLFSDLLRKRLGQISPGLEPELHLRASDWYARQGFGAEAIQHALHARAYERAAALIEDNVEATLMRSEVKTFLDWVNSLPVETLRARPGLSFFHAWALMLSGQPLDVIEQHLRSITLHQQDAESAALLAGRIAALRAYLVLLQADIHQAAELSRQALDNLPESDFFLRSIVAWILSMIRLSDGPSQDGSLALDQVVRMSQRAGNVLVAVAALAHQATLQMRQGRLYPARQTLEQAMQLATGPRGQRLPVASEVLIGLGELEREWNHLEKAAEYLNQSIELARQWNEQSSFDVYFPLMRLRLAQGDIDAARAALDKAIQVARESEISQVDDMLADLYQAYFDVKTGDIAGVLRWAGSRGLLPEFSPAHPSGQDRRQEYIDAHMRKYEQLVLARALILQEKGRAALALLEPLVEQARQLERIDLSIQVHIQRALALQVEGEDGPACAALAEALALAEPGGYMRIFLDEGQPMTRLLRKAAARGVAPAYVDKLLLASGEDTSARRAASVSSTPSLVEPLSQRELDVLRLLAGGLSNPEIARELFVAVSTVRTHCKNIYGKLGVHRRWEAIQRAQELGLI